MAGPGLGRVFAMRLLASSIRPDGYLTVTYHLAPSEVLLARSTTDPIEAIRRLGELRQAGLITDEEYEAKKRELLD